MGRGGAAAWAPWAQRLRLCGLPSDLSGPCGGLFTPDKDLLPTRSEAALAHRPGEGRQPGYGPHGHHGTCLSRLCHPEANPAPRGPGCQAAGQTGGAAGGRFPGPWPTAACAASQSRGPSSPEAMEILYTLFPSQSFRNQVNTLRSQQSP